MKTSLVTRAVPVASALLLSFALCAEGNTLITTGGTHILTSLSIEQGKGRAQQFHISDFHWEIERFRAATPQTSQPPQRGSTLVAFIYSGAVTPETKVASLTFSNDSWLTPTAPLVLGPGSYWLAIERWGDVTENWLWGFGDWEPGTASSPEFLNYFSVGAVANNDIASTNSWVSDPDHGHRFTVRGWKVDAIPEPGTVTLLAAGAVGMALLYRRARPK